MVACKVGNAPFRSVPSPNPLFPRGVITLIKIQGMDISQRKLVLLLEAVKIPSIFWVKFVVTMLTIRLLMITFMEVDQTNLAPTTVNSRQSPEVASSVSTHISVQCNAV